MRLIRCWHVKNERTKYTFPRFVADEFVAALESAFSKMFSDLENNPDYTSVINETHTSRLAAHVDDANVERSGPRPYARSVP